MRMSLKIIKTFLFGKVVFTTGKWLEYQKFSILYMRSSHGYLVDSDSAWKQWVKIGTNKAFSLDVKTISQECYLFLC